MRVYLDTSVILRRLFNDPHPIEGWGKWKVAYASRIWKVEAQRTIQRIRLDGRIDDSAFAQLQEEIEVVDSALTIIPLTESILTRASAAFPTSLGTLDAIHLASAISIPDSSRIDRFLSHDRQLAIAARSLGYEVHGIA